MPISSQPPTHDPELFGDFADAIEDDDRSGLENLLASGADPNICTKDGQTPILYAIRFARSAMAQLLLDAGANPDSADEDYWSPLVQAAHDARVFSRLTLSDSGERSSAPSKLPR